MKITLDLNAEQIEALAVLGITPVAAETLYNDWRLPSIKELLTLVNFNKVNPACDLSDTKSFSYWGSTTYKDDNNNAWFIRFGYGGIYNNCKSNISYVRCVRDGKDGLEWSATSETMTWDEAMNYAANLTAPVFYRA